jgi:hypothetical protein
MSRRRELSLSEQREREVGFAGLEIHEHLERATEELRELIADGALTLAAVCTVENATRKFQTVLREVE